MEAPTSSGLISIVECFDIDNKRSVSELCEPGIFGIRTDTKYSHN